MINGSKQISNVGQIHRRWLSGRRQGHRRWELSIKSSRGSRRCRSIGGNTDKGDQQGGKQSGAKEMPQETLESLSAHDLVTRAQLVTVREHFLKNRLALERAKMIAYIRGISREGGTGADEEIMLTEIDVLE
eukprot:1156307-Pelagomonas_calceolata.AAC.3